MEGSDFIFDYIHLVHYKFHKINLQCGGSCIDSSDWIKSKKTTINPINKKDNNRFQYVVTTLLNHEEIKKDHQRITKPSTAFYR